MFVNIALLASFVLVYTLIAGRMQGGLVSGAILFTGFGLVFGPAGLGWFEPQIQSAGLRMVAELALALVLFTDAAGVDMAVLRRSFGLPTRLLLVGLPLTIAAGFLAGLLIFDHLPLLELAILAVILAPTDAALGKAVLTDESVPGPIRNALNVESGLNDGICVPLVLILLALAAQAATAHAASSLALVTFAEEIGIGLVVGLGCATLAVPAARSALRRGWTDPGWIQFTVPALALLCFAAAQAAGGSGFIACFVGGLLAGAMIRREKHMLLRPAEGIGETLGLLTWVIFGALIVGRADEVFALDVMLYAVLTLTVLRMVPVFLALTGSGLSIGEKLFVGWFGPRGLASIVFAILVLDAGVDGGGLVVATAVWTIILSVVAHGLTAGPLAKVLGRRTHGPAAPEAGEQAP
jgi:NhaP-type Na+/H+ or K+/H+ antiporter